ncbi:hypothetical protein SMMN14_05323 [Sphaerulina musiva]
MFAGSSGSDSKYQRLRDEPAADFELTPLEHEQQQPGNNNNSNSSAITSLELSSDEESSDLHRRQLQQQQHLLENGGGDAKFRLSKHAALENEEYGSAAVMEGVVAVWGKWGKYCLIGGMAMMIVA